MRVTCDANIMVRAALNRKGLARVIVDLATQGPHALVLSAPLLDDVRRVLHYDHIQKRYGIPDRDIDHFLHFLQGTAEFVLQPTIVPVVAADPDDDIVIATAVDGRAEVIVTKDRHLADPAVVSYCAGHNVRILSDVDLVRELRQSTP